MLVKGATGGRTHFFVQYLIIVIMQMYLKVLNF